MAVDGAQEHTEAGDGVPEQQRYDELNLSNAKTIRKPTRATRWTGKLAKALEGYLKGVCDLTEGELAPGSAKLEMQAALGEELALAVWHIVLDCDGPGKEPLKEAAKQKNKRDHKKKEKAKGSSKSSQPWRRKTDSSNKHVVIHFVIELLEHGLAQTGVTIEGILLGLESSKASHGHSRRKGTFQRQNLK